MKKTAKTVLCAALVCALCLAAGLILISCSEEGPTVDLPTRIPTGDQTSGDTAAATGESFSPSETTGPTGPATDPTALTDPTSPDGPTAPTEPTATSETPTAPTETAAPTAPTVPTEPTAPTETTEPTQTPVVAVTGVRFVDFPAVMNVGDSFELKIGVTPENATDKRATYRSSDVSVADIVGGRLIAKGAGAATVTVTTADGGHTAEATVTVRGQSDIPNAFRYGEDGLPLYTPHFEEGVEYVDYNPVNTYHIFCHNLVAFDDPDDYFFSDCITVKEFKRILEQVYARGYVLIDIDYMYDYYYNDSGLLCARIKNSIKLPKGKKPLILSVDNVAYPRGEHGKGRCDRLQVVDGKLMTYTKLSDGRDYYSDDNEVFTILENFISAHPDFSFSGAKCVVAPSGYEGLFGWDTIPGSANYAQSVAECKKIVKWFNEHGYVFACHSYYHKDFNKMTADQVKDDRAHWMNECYPIVGRTHIFIYPFGAFTNPKEENGLRNARLLHEAGYAVFCATSYLAPNWNNFPLEGNCYNERVTLAAKLFTIYPKDKTLAALFDVYSVYDNDAHGKKLTK